MSILRREQPAARNNEVAVSILEAVDQVSSAHWTKLTTAERALDGANAAMESFFSSLKTQADKGQLYRTRDTARPDVLDDVERFYNTIRRHSTIGYLSPAELEKKAGLA